jgi:hypothetical protein
MVRLDEKQIKGLPIHDSDLEEISSIQKDDGNVDLSIKIKLSADCLKEFQEYEIGQGNEVLLVRFLLKNCWWIDLHQFGNTTKKDEVDYVEVIANSPKLKELKIKKSVLHIVMHFITGSRLDVISEEVWLEK